MAATAVRPITGVRDFRSPRKEDDSMAMLRRGLILDIGIALGTGFVMANAYWYGYHMPRTNARDNYYKKLEEERAARMGA
ncbi:hypothetical protein QR685DRAFT_566912 [Neurospora intermedia]|uniref:Cytochrome c oxidase subunit 9, mitochondrial n=1 Tax=Neurospora intermedia TaxID=5142 RepID=A0ABR3CXP9_NEUIN